MSEHVSTQNAQLSSQPPRRWLGEEISGVSISTDNDCKYNNTGPYHVPLVDDVPARIEGSVLHGLLGMDESVVCGMLCGPSRCGKSSLAMDLAWNICKNDELSGNQDPAVHPCRYSVVFIKHESKRGSGFPIKCCCTDSDPLTAKWTSAMDALGRIQIKYATTAQDVIRYLLSIQTLSADRLPFGGIIMDDVHLFLMSSSERHPSGTETFIQMKLFQMIACLENTASFLNDARQRILFSKNSYRSHIFITLDVNQVSLTSTIKIALSKWLEQYFVICSKKGDDNCDETTNMTVKVMKACWELKSHDINPGKSNSMHVNGNKKNEIIYTIEKNSIAKQPLLCWKVKSCNVKCTNL